eukprot:COSAG02_NODE_417_length_22746_cov_9.074172_9_plen_498_part_00
MHIWDVQASLDNNDEVFEATVIVSKLEIYLTNMLTDPDDPNGIDQRWDPSQVERRLQPSNGQIAETTLILNRRRARGEALRGTDGYSAATFTLIFDDPDACDQAARTIEIVCPLLNRTSIRRPSISPFIASSSSSRVERPTLNFSVTGTCTTPDPSDADNSSNRGSTDSNSVSGALGQSDESAANSDQSSSKKQSIRIKDVPNVREYESDNENSERDDDERDDDSISLSDTNHSEPTQGALDEDEEDFKPNLRQPSQQSEDDEEEDFKPNLRQPSQRFDDDEEDDSHSQQMEIVRGQLGTNAVQSKGEDDAALQEDNQDGGFPDEESQVLVDSEGEDRVDEIDEIRIGGKLLRNLKLAELKIELSERLPEDEIPRKWPRKSELVQMLASTILAQAEEAENRNNKDSNDADAYAGDDRDDPSEHSADCYLTSGNGTTQDMAVDMSEHGGNDNLDKARDVLLELRGKAIKNLKVSELKDELQSRLDDSIIQDLSKPKWP